MTVAPLTCWIISDGRRGIENQALGLAEALGRLREINIKAFHVAHGALFSGMSANLQATFKSGPDNYGFSAPFPEIAIGCGRQAIAPLLVLKRRLGAQIFTTYIQHPRIPVTKFDLVVAPRHDNLEGDNVETMIGSPNRITPSKISDAAQEFSPRLKALAPPRAAVLIGGHSKTHKLTSSCHEFHIQAVTELLAKSLSVMVTLSRRTPDFARKSYRALASQNAGLWLYDGEGPNPYFAFLDSADYILVTEDSTNMLTEACTTGKPVFTLPMEGAPKKFKTLYDELHQRCHIRPFDGILDAPAYSPLTETDRIAKSLWTRFDNHTT